MHLQVQFLPVRNLVIDYTSMLRFMAIVYAVNRKNLQGYVSMKSNKKLRNLGIRELPRKGLSMKVKGQRHQSLTKERSCINSMLA